MAILVNNMPKDPLTVRRMCGDKPLSTTNKPALASGLFYGYMDGYIEPKFLS